MMILIVDCGTLEDFVSDYGIVETMAGLAAILACLNEVQNSDTKERWDAGS